MTIILPVDQDKCDIERTKWCHLGFSEIHAEYKNLPILPNFAKIKNPLNILKFKFSNFISFWNTLILS